MAITRCKTERAKSNSDEIVIDVSFWEKLPKEKIYTPEELESLGYRNAEYLAKLFGCAEKTDTVKKKAIRLGLKCELKNTKIDGRICSRLWFYKPS